MLSLELKTVFPSFFLNGTVQGTSLDLDHWLYSYLRHVNLLLTHLKNLRGAGRPYF